MPCCFDALSARLVERAGFPLTFMSGFAVSATRLALPDTGLISYGEMVDQGRAICQAVDIPVIGDGDTGYGNAVNVRRAVKGYAEAGFSAVMIEDQLSPKRCGHTQGKKVVPRDEALMRLRAAVDMAAEMRAAGRDILVLARTDARATHGFDEALLRARAFKDIGADILFLEAPETEQEMAAFCAAVPGPKLANMLEEGKTPVLPPARLQEIGYKIAAYPLTLLSASVKAMEGALDDLKAGTAPRGIKSFADLRQIVGFDAYDVEAARYAEPDGDGD
ncbi:MAG: isocitrate lyase/PEP mutase family protein [Rhodospirillaceae bacterium]|nr:isocitrate lyase/PEP mutase family protein [Rhodospirillaceae bacterium]MBT5373267.1 isocitrate lyase/PEP mutase family protein [Rhodospirillaceae bacterium]MBT5658739.1 isocitrate lyase/PEP mutase family protein [Rhodospirillaceae bacterium]MBT5751192.1 isocitrate lyase/PEP mutase family protein [Rhodospirillaceae bacterium]